LGENEIIYRPDRFDEEKGAAKVSEDRDELMPAELHIREPLRQPAAELDRATLFWVNW